VGERNDIGLYRTLVGLGVTDYLLRSDLTVQQLRRAVLTAGRQDSEPAETPKAALGKVIVFIGVRGGVGETALCTSVAWRLANTHNQQVALVDLDMQFGTTALSLDLDPGTGFRDALENYERIDSLFVASAMVPLGSNLNVLCAEESPARGMPPSQEATQRLMNVLRPDVEALIIDLPRYLLPSARPMLEAAEHIVLVTDLSLSALRDAARLRQALTDEGLGDAVCFVANRIGLADDGKLTVQEFQNSLKAKFDAVIPEDPKAAKAALEGKPLGAGGAKPKTTEEIARLTRKLGGIAEPAKGGSKWIPKLKVPRRG
jgi:pilus assembly protein CpaE